MTTTQSTGSSTGQSLPGRLHLKRILVPIDFFEPSKKALRYAVPFAESFGARVDLVHVVEPTYYPAEMTYMSGEMANLEEVVKKNARLQLEALASEMIPTQFRGEIATRTGVPFREITSTAKELETDLIILSTDGYKGLKHLFMGSTTERVVRVAPCPVLTVCEQEHEFVELTEPRRAVA